MEDTMRRRMTPMGMLLAVLAIGVFCSAALATGADPSGRADDIKAVFIYKFTGYITWPDDEAETFTLAVLGDSTMTDSLKRIAERRQVNSKQLVIRECTTLDDISGCRIVLVSESMEDDLAAILKKAEAENMLTVSDSPGLARKGVAISFCLIEDRIGFEMNLSAVKRSGLSVSSQLMKLATLVEEDQTSDAGGQPK